MSKKKTPAPPPSGNDGSPPPDPTPRRARDLLPADGPNPVDAERVMAADASLEPEVETRKIGIRRVSCLDFGNKMYDRANRRPAGNSRLFWSRIEADDPFKKAPARPTDAPLEIYAAQRIERTDGSLPKPQPDVARASPPPARSADAAAKPMAPRLERDERAAAERAAKVGRPVEPAEDRAPPPRPRPTEEVRKPRPTPPSEKRVAPEPTHTPEPRPAPRPPPPRAAPEPDPDDDDVIDAPPARPAADQVVPAPPHRLPPKPGGNPKAGTGRVQQSTRQRMPSRAPDGGPAPEAPVPTPVAAGSGKSAAEIRAEKLRAREAGGQDPPPAKKFNLDAYRNYVQLAEIQEAAHLRGEEIPTAFADKADDAPRPKPKAVVSKHNPAGEPVEAPEPPRPAPKPAAPAAKAATPAPKAPAPPAARTAPAAPPVDRTPPKPKPKEEPKAAPKAPAGKPADLDDLFGGANEGRVRIGKRAVPKEPKDPGTEGS
jgi:hypothetical protein